MSRSHKTSAARMAFDRDKPESNDPAVRRKVKRLRRGYKSSGYRYGNNRNFHAETKRIERKKRLRDTDALNIEEQTAPERTQEHE